MVLAAAPRRAAAVLLVAVPALDLAAASGAAATAITRVLALARRRGGMRQPWDTRDAGEVAKIGT